MKFATAIAPHRVGFNTVQRMMWLVVAALTPAVIVHVLWFGWGLVINIAIATVSALVAEALVLALRKKAIGMYVTDGSAVITAMLLAFALPPLVPWWITASGAAFAIVVAKHLYGGLGYNVFNPAMVGYAALLVSFPVHMTRWLLPAGLASAELSFVQTLHTIFIGKLPTELAWDAISGATPLVAVRTYLGLRATMEEINAQPIFGLLAGVGSEWVAVAIAVGGIALLALRVIRWQIPVAMLGTVWLCSSVMHTLNPGAFSGPLLHLFGGATMLCAFFIATDPVSAATSDRGRLLYGIGIGLLTFVIRAWGGYAFAVLLMNAAVPLLDRYTVPRIYGHEK
jgi:Na+-translocating ferredoxin:NAD+ oxidoreductase subunit D